MSKFIGILFLAGGVLLLIITFGSEGKTHSHLDDNGWGMFGSLIGAFLAFIGWALIKDKKDS